MDENGTDREGRYLSLEKDIKKPANFDRFLCGAEWTRTTDSRIFSPMLYHLSYSTLKKWKAKLEIYQKEPRFWKIMAGNLEYIRHAYYSSFICYIWNS